MVQRTLVIIKPDAVGRRLCGRIIERFENKGLKLVGLKLLTMTQEHAEKHYGEHKDQDFFDDLVKFIISGPTIPMVWEGEEAIDIVRHINGATDCADADVGTIRGDFGLTKRNIVHASDSPESAEREIGFFFNKEELVEYIMPDEHWLKYS